MIGDSIVDNSDIPHPRYRPVRRRRDPVHGAIENNIVSHNRIGDHLYPLAGPPNNIPLHDIDLRPASIDEDAGILLADIRIVNDIVPNDIAV